MPVSGKDFLTAGSDALLTNKINQANSAFRATQEVPAGQNNRAREAAKDFEALLVGEMLKSMWANVGSEGLLSGGREEEIYREMLNEALAKSMAESQSIGIADIISRELERLEPK
jgi:Rod binding domain-containing protein